MQVCANLSLTLTSSHLVIHERRFMMHLVNFILSLLFTIVYRDVSDFELRAVSHLIPPVRAKYYSLVKVQELDKADYADNRVANYQDVVGCQPFCFLGEWQICNHVDCHWYEDMCAPKCRLMKPKAKSVPAFRVLRIERDVEVDYSKHYLQNWETETRIELIGECSTAVWKVQVEDNEEEARRSWWHISGDRR